MVSKVGTDNFLSLNSRGSSVHPKITASIPCSFTISSAISIKRHAVSSFTIPNSNSFKIESAIYFLSVALGIVTSIPAFMNGALKKSPSIVAIVPSSPTFLKFRFFASIKVVSTMLTSGIGDCFCNSSNTMCPVLQAKAPISAPAAARLRIPDSKYSVRPSLSPWELIRITSKLLRLSITIGGKYGLFNFF